MGDVSNKTLAFLLVAAIVVSVAGIFMVNDKLSGVSQITGFASTGTGEVNITVTESISLNVTDSVIDFGASNMAGVTNNVTCDSEDGTENVDGSVADSFDGAACESGDKISIWNDGNVQINITMNVTENASQFMCTDTGDPDFSDCNARAVLQFKTPEEDCGVAVASYTTFTKNTPTMICGELDVEGAAKYWVNVTAYAVIPHVAKTSSAESTVDVRFVASKSTA